MNKKKRAYKGWVMKAPVISTGHLTRATADELGCHPPQQDNAFDVIAIPTGYGVMVHCKSASELAGAPPDLRRCGTWARKFGFDWLRFDADGDVVAELPWYEWEAESTGEPA